MTRTELIADYDRSAREYLASLPMEHFMEATPQATQRSIFCAAFEQIHLLRPDVYPFSELLLQYEYRTRRRQVVPDNMVVLHPGEIEATTSYVLALQPAAPLLVLEYVSKHNKRKDYETSFAKYERELKIPYYLLFYPDNEEMTLFRRVRSRYAAVAPDERGRVAIPEIEVEAALHEGWVRFWFRGQRMARPAEMLQELAAKDREIERLQRLLAEQAGG